MITIIKKNQKLDNISLEQDKKIHDHAHEVAPTQIDFYSERTLKQREDDVYFGKLKECLISNALHKYLDVNPGAFEIVEDYDLENLAGKQKKPYDLIIRDTNDPVVMEYAQNINNAGNVKIAPAATDSAKPCPEIRVSLAIKILFLCPLGYWPI